MLRFLLSDNESLANYMRGKFATFDDVKRRMLLKLRTQNAAVPDHIYRLEQEITFRNLDSIADILTIGITDIANKLLELESTKVYVKSQSQNDWQEIITYIPPLLLQSTILFKEAPNDIKNNADSRHQYFKDYLLPNTRYTAIAHARIPQLDYLVKQQGGLHDLHMHLNGSLETDQVWQDYLLNPRVIYKDLKDAFKNSKVREQMEQESYLFKPLRYVTLLKAAQKLRVYFFDYLFPNSTTTFDSKNSLLRNIVSNSTDLSGSYKHPFLPLITDNENYSGLMSIEALMYIMIIQELATSKNETLAGFFHFYLSILGLTNRLLVQQSHQNGFEQFQKHTLNGLRESSEKMFLRRYYQMHGNELKHIRFLEGRFSPKKTENEMLTFLSSIFNGWDKMKNDIRQQHGNDLNMPELRLIAHFIKKADTRPDDFIRHKELRYDTAKRAQVLALLLKNHNDYQKKVVAVDAAASEFDAPPEVFAPVFRKMRRAGIKHFTYHAGEDFYHILSGLRAIYEAVVFCGLQKADRIGHATASGLCPKQWGEIIGNTLSVRRGDYLDDMVFTYHLIVKNKIEALHVMLPFIVNKINELSFLVYNEHYPVAVLEQAWLMRQCCPVHALEDVRENISSAEVYSEEEWDFMIDKGFAKNRNEKKESPNKVKQVFEMYHNRDFRERFEEIIVIDTYDILKAEHIEIVQLTLLDEMTKKEIVIETLPTSNVRIGFHRNFKTYHLWKWAKWFDEGKSIPPIVVGSDDTGIFATNIYNEYANIYCMLLNTYHMPHSKVMDIIKRLDEDSRIYRFE